MGARKSFLPHPLWLVGFWEGVMGDEKTHRKRKAGTGGDMALWEMTMVCLPQHLSLYMVKSGAVHVFGKNFFYLPWSDWRRPPLEWTIEVRSGWPFKVLRLWRPWSWAAQGPEMCDSEANTTVCNIWRLFLINQLRNVQKKNTSILAFLCSHQLNSCVGVLFRGARMWDWEIVMYNYMHTTVRGIEYG